MAHTLLHPSTHPTPSIYYPYPHTHTHTHASSLLHPLPHPHHTHTRRAIPSQPTCSAGPYSRIPCCCRLRKLPLCTHVSASTQRCLWRQAPAFTCTVLTRSLNGHLVQRNGNPCPPCPHRSDMAASLIYHSEEETSRARAFVVLLSRYPGPRLIGLPCVPPLTDHASCQAAAHLPETPNPLSP